MAPYYNIPLCTPLKANPGYGPVWIPFIITIKKMFEQDRIWEWVECGSEVKLYSGLLLRLAETNIYEGKEYLAVSACKI